MSEKNKIVPALISVLLAISMFYTLHEVGFKFDPIKEHVTVGYVCDGDESQPYSQNFILAMDTLEMQYGSTVSIIARTNVPAEEVNTTIDELVGSKCDIIFFNSTAYCEIVKESAARYPSVQFCQACAYNANEEPVLKNFHTFMGEIYEGRYISGRIAGMKLNELIKDGTISKDEAIIGYVGAYPYPEVISGYTAFFLGAREECPTAVMHVRYTDSWGNYRSENIAASALIEEGAVIISQHSDTIGPAVACEYKYKERPVFHIGYNQDMIGVAPNTSIIGTRIDWTSYVSSAVEAVRTNKKIEKFVKGNVHGNDISAGFDQGWVRMLDLNYSIAPEGADELIDKVEEEFKKGNKFVFVGDYTGVNVDDPNDIIDLRTGYVENKSSSYPAFNYVLNDVIIIDPSE